MTAGQAKTEARRSWLMMTTNPRFLIGGLQLAKTPSPPLLIPYGSWVFNFYEVCHFRQKSVSLC